jgi:hypothetical protein
VAVPRSPPVLRIDSLNPAAELAKMELCAMRPRERQTIILLAWLSTLVLLILFTYLVART